MNTIFHKLSHQVSDAWNLNPYRWDWSSGVGLIGLCEAHAVVGTSEWRDYLNSWFEQVVADARFGSVNHVAPANVPLYLLGLQENERCRETCQRYARWCCQEAVRTSNGGWAHVWEGGDPDYRNQLWVDTVFMAVTFLARYGIAFRDKAAVEQALAQAVLHVECLFDPSAGLFRHAYHCERNAPLGEHWGRGNGWMVASLAQLLDLLAEERTPGRRLRECFVTAMETAYLARGYRGLLRTLPLVQEAYLETTASSLFGYAALRGHALGLLDDRFRTWGMQIATTVADLVDEAGAIAGCSHGTNPDPRAVYLALPFTQALYADGIVLMVLSQAYLCAEAAE